MTDVLGPRLKLGILVPSTNSTVQPEMDDLRPDGVTNHVSRIKVPNQTFHTDADAAAIVEASQPDLLPAVDRVMDCNPDRLIMAMAVPCFWDGVAASNSFRQRLVTRAGVPVVTPPEAFDAALKQLGANRIAAISPYMPLADQHVARWFDQKGYDVLRVSGLRAAREDAVVDVDESSQLQALRDLATLGADALLQVGTSMASTRLVERFEREFGVPVLAVNCVCYWHALRTAGLGDQLSGFGRLLRDY